MKIGVEVKIDVSKIDKARIFKGEKGNWLTLTTFIDIDQADQYGNHGFISPKKEQGEGNTPILGNVKIFWRGEAAAPPQQGYGQYPQAAPPQQIAPPQAPPPQAYQAPPPQQAYQPANVPVNQPAPPVPPVNQVVPGPAVTDPAPAPAPAPEMVTFDDDIPF